ncbi:MAG: hypothetical protein ACJA0O_001658 [Porticoccus sp.]|jgi:hypothetical protein
MFMWGAQYCQPGNWPESAEKCLLLLPGFYFFKIFCELLKTTNIFFAMKYLRYRIDRLANGFGEVCRTDPLVVDIPISSLARRQKPQASWPKIVKGCITFLLLESDIHSKYFSFRPTIATANYCYTHNSHTQLLVYYLLAPPQYFQQDQDRSQQVFEGMTTNEGGCSKNCTSRQGRRSPLPRVSVICQ